MFAKTFLIASLSFVAIASAQADEVTPDPFGSFVSTLTRAEVREAVIQAQRDGFVQNGDRTVFAEPSGMAKTRAQVVAETREATRLGIRQNGDGNLVITDAQLESIRMAGLAALPMTVAAR
jgi:Domain of unknown function (DUF4148)